MKNIHVIMIACCIILSTLVRAYAVSADSGKAMQEGYSAHLLGQDEKAYGHFLRAYELDKSNTTALKELGYADVRAGRLEKAVSRFREVLAVNPGDMRARLDLGYALQKKGDLVPARAEFEIVAKSPGEFQGQAIKALEAMRGPAAAPKSALATSAARKMCYAEFFAAPYHMTRFRDSIASAEGRFYVKTGENSPLSAYAGARYVQDSRSKGGIAPDIYNDNIFSYGLGLRLDHKAGISLTVEYFLAHNLIKTVEHPAGTEGDFRAALAGYREFPGRICGPAGLLSAGTLRATRFFTSLGGSVGYYNRYRDNVIGQFQSMEGWRVFDGAKSRISLYLRSMVAADTNSDFFNNLAEIGPGAELQPFTGQNLRLRLDYVLGSYLGREGRDKNPYGPNYHDTRLSLNYGVRF